MVLRNIPMYQARIPIRGGGGHIDLRERQENPIVAALERIIQRKRQTEQDELGRRLTEARIGQMEQPQGMQGQIVTAEGKTWLVDRRTGEKRDLGIPAPKGKASTALLNAWLKLGQYAEPTPTEEAMRGALGQELLGERGLEEYDIPGEKRSRLGIDILAKDIPARKGVRKKKEERHLVRRKKAKAKEAKRPPKPKEYPDAKWSEEHQMWTIIRNGRLMGVK